MSKIVSGYNVRMNQQPGSDLVAFPEWIFHVDNSGTIYSDLFQIIDNDYHAFVLGDFDSAVEIERIKADFSEIFVKIKNKSDPKIKGVYGLFIYDKKNNEVYVCNDRYGHGYVYVWKDSNKIVFSTDLEAVSKISDFFPEQSLEAICDIHNYHGVMGNETIYKNVSMLPPATICRVAEGHVELSSYYDYPKEKSISEQTVAELALECKERVRDSIVKCAGQHENVGVLLTGGLDSRLISGVLRTCLPEKPVRLIHFFETDDEAAIVRQIAKTLNCELDIFSRDDKDWLDVLDKTVKLTHGEWGVYEFLPHFEAIRTKYPGLKLLNGYLFDTLFKSAFSFKPGSSPTLDDYVKRFGFLGDYLVEMIFSPDFGEFLKQRKRQRILEASVLSGENRVTETSIAFYINQRGRRAIYYASKMLSKYATVLMPGLNHELFDYAWNLPVALRSSPSFYKQLIADWFPELEKIPWEKTGKPLRYDADPQRNARQYKLARCKYALQRGTHGWLDLVNHPNSFDRRLRTNKRLRMRVKEILLDHSSLNRGFYDRDGIETLFKRQMSGRDHGDLFKSLLTTEMMLRTYIDGK